MTTFRDIFRSSFLEAFPTGGLPLHTVAECFLITGILAVYIFFYYQFLTRKTFYNKAFNMAIPVLALIVCAIVLTIQSNIVVSLGMVGALSIVRFRTAIKSPMDLIFLFWAIAIGIICGSSAHLIAILLSVGITIGIFVMELLPVAKAPMLLIINASEKTCLQEIHAAVKAHTKRYHVKSQSIETDRLNMIIEVCAKDSIMLLEKVGDIPAVVRCSLVSHDGEVTF